MKHKLKELLSLSRTARQHSVAMQHKLLLYWISMLFVIFGALLVILSIAGVFSESEKRLHQALTLQQENTVTALNEQSHTLTAQGIAVSEQVSNVLDNMLFIEPVSVLNNDSERLKIAQRDLYGILNTALRSSPCNGAYLVLDATINTSAAGAEVSRAGLYLRFANLNTKNAVDQDVTVYRGIPDIARENQLELHNRWKMEFDTSLMDGYQEAITPSGEKLSASYRWTQRVPLTDTWENVMLLMVPVKGSRGTVRGICGVELSDLFFRLSYPAHESAFGNMVTVIAPLEEEGFVLSKGMTGDLGGIYLDEEDTLKVEKGRWFDTYTGDSGRFLGIHTQLDFNIAEGIPMYAITLVSEKPYQAIAASEDKIWIMGSLVFLMVMLGLSVFLSRRFVRPILQSLTAIQTDHSQEIEQTGISEIDALLSFLRSRARNTGENTLPADIAQLFDEFAGRAAKLTATERRILRAYADGKDVGEVAELSFISIHTVRRHNANIYQKLGVGSRDELMLYIELFRRCGRLEELLSTQEDVTEKNNTEGDLT